VARETSALKAERLLVSGRVTVVRADGRHIRAIVRGDSEGFHVVEHDAGRWSCDCSALGACSHRLAPQLITAPVGGPVLSPDVMIGGRS
jgi:uncharacterized Zn finger protein